MENLKQVDLTKKIETRFCAWHPEEKKLLWFDALLVGDAHSNGCVAMFPYGMLRSVAIYSSNVSNHNKDDVIILPYSDNYVVKDGELFLKQEYAPGTVGYYLDQLQEPYRAQALENAVDKISYYKGIEYEVKSIYDAIYFGFAWDKTPKNQGAIYWSDFYNSLFKNGK